LQAIAELIGALVVALAQALAVMVEAAAGLLAIVAEFMFLALTQGLAAASEKYKHREADRKCLKETATACNDVRHAKTQPSISLKRSAIIGSIVVLSVGCGVATLVIQSRLRRQRIESTRAQVAELADSFAKRIKDREVAAPEPGELSDRDAWKQPIGLFVDKALLGSMVVVRSSGPDRKSGTLDDILAIRVIPANAKDLGGELANRGIKGIRDRVAQLLAGGEKEKLPKHVDVDEK
jgi:hypothetical protein